jgi:membrane protease YdiL (CAAX protease family)
MESEVPDSRRFVAVATACEAALVFVARALGWFLSRPPLAQIDWTAQAVGYGLLATLPLVAGLVLITRYPLGPLKPLDKLVQEFLVPLFRPARIWELFLISALAGIGEELLFRGVLQAGVEQFSGSSWLALALASLLFGLAHPISTTYAVLAALIGGYLGWLWMATGNLLVPIVTHGAYDFVALVYLIRRNDELRFPAGGETGTQRGGDAADDVDPM